MVQKDETAKIAEGVIEKLVRQQVDIGETQFGFHAKTWNYKLHIYLETVAGEIFNEKESFGESFWSSA